MIIYGLLCKCKYTLRLMSRKEVEAIFTCEEVAERLRVKTTTVYDWCRKGKISHYSLGRLYLISEEGLEEFLSNHERKAQTEEEA